MFGQHSDIAAHVFEEDSRLTSSIVDSRANDGKVFFGGQCWQNLLYPRSSKIEIFHIGCDRRDVRFDRPEASLDTFETSFNTSKALLNAIETSLDPLEATAHILHIRLQLSHM